MPRRARPHRGARAPRCRPRCRWPTRSSTSPTPGCSCSGLRARRLGPRRPRARGPPAPAAPRAPLPALAGAGSERARELGALGATISGAGPTVLVWCAADATGAVVARLQAEARAGPRSGRRLRAARRRRRRALTLPPADARLACLDGGGQMLTVEDDAARLAAVRRYDILDTPPRRRVRPGHRAGRQARSTSPIAIVEHRRRRPHLVQVAPRPRGRRDRARSRACAPRRSCSDGPWIVRERRDRPALARQPARGRRVRPALLRRRAARRPPTATTSARCA